MIRTRRFTFLATLLVLGAAAGTAGAAASSGDLLNCQKQFESQVYSFTNVVHQKLYGCAESVAECKLAQEIDSVDPKTCLARAATSCGATPAKISGQLAARKAKVEQRCGLIALADLEQYDGGLGFFNVVSACSAGSVNDLVDCVFASAQCAAEHELFRLDPRSQDSLTTAGIAGSFPCTGP
jgi:hypothetical protein